MTSSERTILAFSVAGDPVDAADPRSPVEREVKAREALTAWLQWNAAYEQATARMYRAGANLDSLQQTMDEIDRLRRQAVELSRQLV